MKPVAVVIPSFRRPQSLERAVRSVLAQDDLDRLVEEIVVVDNDPLGSARPIIARLQDEDNRLRYVHAREPGVSNARNAGIAAASAPLIAFIDDDEAAPPHWLGALYDAHLALGVDVTFGPVRGRADAAADWKRAFLEGFFSRTGPAETRLTRAAYGCGNSMLTRSTTLIGPAPFDVAANHTGGEDDRLFARLRGEGRRFGWAGDAWLFEHAAIQRQSVAYALARAYGYGQGPALIAARERNWIGVSTWMAIGVVQLVVYAAAALALAPFGLGRALPFADRACQGLGKAIWFHRLNFYGAGVGHSPAPKPRPIPEVAHNIGARHCGYTDTQREAHRPKCP